MLKVKGSINFVDQLTVMILTFNEEANIERTLRSVSWAKNILVIDSGSSDATRAIVETFTQARIVTRCFDTFAKQCNFGLEHIDTRWVLSMDADYEVSESLVYEIETLSPMENEHAFRAGFIYRIYGRQLRATLYPPRIILYQKDKARYLDEGHGHRVYVTCPIRDLNARVYHDDRKPLSRWLQSQQRYAKVEAAHLLSAPESDLSRNDRIRRIGWLAPILVFLYTLLLKKCMLDGWPGWFYVLQRTLAEINIALEIVDRRLMRTAPHAGTSRSQ